MRRHCLSVHPRSEPRIRVSRKAGLGPVAMAMGEDYRRGDPFDRIDNDFQLITDLGLSEWRGSVSWIDQEPARGQYDFA